MKLASSLDGKIALANGVSQWITSEQSRKDVQKRRAASCAIISGSGTVITDNPRLTVRPENLSKEIADALNYRGKPLIRVIVDGKNQLHGDLQIMNDGNPTVVFNQHRNELLPETVRQHQITSNGEYLALPECLTVLAEDYEVNDLWVEAGAGLAGALLNNGLVDRLLLYQAPIFIGNCGKSLLQLPEITALKDAIHVSSYHVSRVGDDTLFDISFN